MARGKKRYSEAELEKRRQRVCEMNRTGVMGSRWGVLGGRKRANETTDEYRARRRKAFEQAQRGELAPQPKPPVVVTHAQPNEVRAKTDTELQIERAFRRSQPTGRYRSGDWRV